MNKKPVLLRYTRQVNWAAPAEDYKRIYKMRQQNLANIAQSRGAIPYLLSYYGDGRWAQFIADWGMTFDPRELDSDYRYRPFIPYHRQLEYINWVYERWQAQERGLCKKFRGAGMSWLNVGISAAAWLTQPNFITTLGSQKQEKVDNGDGDPDSLFWKVRKYITMLPVIFLPEGWLKESKKMVVFNPENGSSIRGEIGDQIGRGGRAQPLDAEVRTPEGWTTIGQLQLGDKVFAPNGQPTSVIALHPQGEVPIYRVWFSDGTSTECSADHVWQVTTPSIRKSLRRQAQAKSGARSGRHWGSVDFLLYTTAQLAENLYQGYETRYHIPITQPITAQPRRGAFPLSAYALGAMLGDGGLTQLGEGNHGLATFATPEVEFAELLAEELPDSWKLSRASKVDWRITMREPTADSPRAIFTQLGLAGLGSHEKFIPPNYLYDADFQMKVDLIQGLIDSDGWITRRKNSCKVNFVSTSELLARGLVELVQSIGGTATLNKTSEESCRRFPQGKICGVKPMWGVVLKMPPGATPARLSRKVQNFVSPHKYKPTRAIRSIEYIGTKPAQCITVANPNGLYLTNDYIVTHNCSIAFPDEFAELEHQELVESALAETADCVIYGSTVPSRGGVGSKFYELEHHLPEQQVFIFEWTQDERKRLNPHLAPEEEPWYIKKAAEVSPVVFASQFLLNYSAATSNAFVDSAIVQKAFAFRKSAIIQPPSLAWRVGVDASGMGNDKTKIWRRRGRLSLPAITREKINGVQLAQLIVSICTDLLTSGPVELIAIERDGPGGSAADQLLYSPFRSILAAIHTGIRLKDGKHYNLRAWLHTQALEYMEEGCHIPTSHTFLSQATAIQHEFKGGLLLIESKEDYRKRFSSGRTRAEKLSGKSPDEWDSFVLTFCPPVGSPIHSTAPAPGSSSRAKWVPQDKVMGY